MSDVDIFYQIANLKETDYKNTLIITSIVELLVEKNILSRKEIYERACKLDRITVSKGTN